MQIVRIHSPRVRTDVSADGHPAGAVASPVAGGVLTGTGGKEASRPRVCGERGWCS